MATTIKIGKKAKGIAFDSIRPVNREPKLEQTHPGYGERLNLVAQSLSPTRVASILDSSTRGNLTWLHEVYDKMETDIDVGGHKQVATSTLGSGQIVLDVRQGFNEGDEALAKEYHDLCCLMLETLKPKHRDIIKELTVGYMRGVKAFQIEYKAMDVAGKKLAIPTNLKPISGQRYHWDCDATSKDYGQLKIATSNKPDGEYLYKMAPGKVFEITDGYGRGRYDLLGVYRRAVSFWLLKLYVMSWWGDRVEIFGEPIRVGRYPQGTNPATLSKIESFLATMGRTAYALLPDNVNLQMLEAASSANGGLSVHGEIIRYLDNKIAFTFLGQSDTSSNPSHGSRARTDSLMNISWDVITDYGAGVAGGISELLKAALLQNYGEVKEHLVPHARLLVKNPAILASNTERLLKLKEGGVPISAQAMYEQTGNVRPTKGDIVFTAGGFEEYDESKRPVEMESGQDDQQKGREGSGEKVDTGSDKKKDPTG